MVLVWWGLQILTTTTRDITLALSYIMVFSTRLLSPPRLLGSLLLLLAGDWCPGREVVGVQGVLEEEGSRALLHWTGWGWEEGGSLAGAAPERSEILRRSSLVIDGIEKEGMTRYWELECQAWETEWCMWCGRGKKCVWATHHYNETDNTLSAGYTQEVMNSLSTTFLLLPHWL